MNSSPSLRRTQRGPRADGDSRAEILEAARTLFAARGFQGATTRSIAERAGVDVALIHYFFGTKAGLFAAAIDLPAIAAQIEARIVEPSGDRAEALARLYLEQLFTQNITTFSALLRTALGSPEAMPELRRLVEQTMITIASRVLGGPDAALRAELIGAQMIGILVLRHLAGVEPIASASVDAIVAQLRGPLQALIGEERA